MRKSIALMLCTVAVTLLFSCGSQGKKSQANTSTSDVKNTATPIDVHNARNSLDYMGQYHGVIPDAADKPLNVCITLEKDCYSMEMSYSDNPGKVQKSGGTYSWNEEGNAVTLEGEDIPNQYFVKENALTLRDLKTDSLHIFSKQ